MTMLLLIVVLVVSAFGQTTVPSSPPDSFEYVQGHGLGGHDTLTWRNGKLVILSVPFNDERRKVVKEYEPSPQDWERFWRAMDAANVWEWKAEYPPAVNISDAQGWSLELTHAGHTLKSRGFDNEPPEFGAFREAVEQLISTTAWEWGTKSDQVGVAIALTKQVYTLEEPIQVQVAREDFGSRHTATVGECEEITVELRDADMNRIASSPFPEICVGEGLSPHPFPKNKLVTQEFSLGDVGLNPIFPGTYHVVATWHFASDTWPGRICAPHCLMSISSKAAEVQIVDPDHKQAKQSPWPTTPAAVHGLPEGFEQVDTTIGPRTALRDKRTGLLWLHLNLSETSHESVMKSMQAGGWLQGWRYATPEEVRDLFAHYTQTPDGKSTDARVAASFQNDLGGPLTSSIDPRQSWGRTISNAILPLPCTLNQGRTQGFTMYAVIMNDNFTGARIDPSLQGCTTDGLVGIANYLVQREKSSSH